MATVRKVSWTYKGATKSAWQVTYTDPATGKRPSKNFQAKKAADAYRLKIEQEIESGMHTAAAKTRTIAQVCEAFLRNAEERRDDGRIGPTRYRMFKRLVDFDVIPQMGNVPMTELTVAMVDALYTRLMKGRRMQPYIARARINILGQIEDFALRHEWTKRAVVPRVLRDLRGLERPVQRRFDPETVLALLARASKRRLHVSHRGHLQMQCFVNIAAFCGLRWGEIQGLTVENIDFEAGMIQVRHNLTHEDLLKGPKTKAGVRDVPMPGHVALLLKDWLAKYRTLEKRNLVFRTPKGNIVSDSSFRTNRWVPLLRSAGLHEDKDDPDGLHFHALRGFAASWWIENGVPVTTVAKWLGHAKPDMTLDFYARSLVSKTGQRELMDRMADRLLTAPPAAIDAIRTREVSLSA